MGEGKVEDMDGRMNGRTVMDDGVDDCWVRI